MKDLSQVSPWLVDDHLLPVSFHTVFPPRVFLNPNFSASHMGAGPTLATSS